MELHLAINDSAGPARYIETLTKVRDIRNRFQPDIYILGFRGHEIYWPLRRLIGKKPIIFDAMMSPYSALKEEGKHGLPGRIAAQIVKPAEAWVLRDADRILTDTNLHAQHFARTFSLPRSKITPLPVGAVESANPGVCPRPGSDTELSLLFYGSFLPLHGIEVIVAAAKILRNAPLRFDFIGGGSEARSMLEREFPSPARISFTHRNWVAFDEIVSREIPGADLCLGGPFGDTLQARRVVTGKTSQCLALGKPTLIGAIDEEVGFRDKENCLVVRQGSAQALADAIRWAEKNRDELAAIGARGRELYNRRLSISVIREKLEEVILSL